MIYPWLEFGSIRAATRALSMVVTYGLVSLVDTVTRRAHQALLGHSYWVGCVGMDNYLT